MVIRKLATEIPRLCHAAWQYGMSYFGGMLSQYFALFLGNESEISRVHPQSTAVESKEWRLIKPMFWLKIHLLGTISSAQCARHK